MYLHLARLERYIKLTFILGVSDMPLIKMRTIWTPLALVGFKLLKDDEGCYYFKLFNSQLKKLRN